MAKGMQVSDINIDIVTKEHGSWKPHNKPPLGITPESIWHDLRRKELVGAINRYAAHLGYFDGPAPTLSNEERASCMQAIATWANELYRLTNIN